MVSIEHIAPQTQTVDWDQELYAYEGTIDRLGNLILIPGEENSAMSNQNWSVKRACYQILSATSPDAADEARASAKEAGIMVPPRFAPGLLRDLHALAAGVAQFDGEWSSEIVQSRSEALAGLAWERLSPWVGK